MPRFVKGELAIETAIPAEASRLRAQGFAEQKAKTTAVREADAERATEADAVKATPAPAKPAK